MMSCEIILYGWEIELKHRKDVSSFRTKTRGTVRRMWVAFPFLGSKPSHPVRPGVGLR